MGKKKKSEVKNILVNDKLLNTLLENINDIIMIIDESGLILFATPSIQKLTGDTPNELIGKNVFAFIHEEDLLSAQKLLIDVLAADEAQVNIEKRILHKDGTTRYVIGKGINLISNSDIKGILLNIQDNTEKLLIEKSNKMNRILFSNVEEISKVGGWEYVVHSKKMFWTEETYLIHDIEPYSIPSGSFELVEASLQCYPEPGRTILWESFQNCYKNGIEYQHEFPFVTKNGRSIWIQTTAKPFYRNNRIEKVYGNIIDISEKKRNELLAEARLNLIDFSYHSDLDSFLQKFLDEAERLTQSKIGFYHFVEEDQETLRLQMWSTNTINSMCTAEGKGSHYNISKAGVWTDCVITGKPVIHNDYESLSHKKGLPEGHAPVIRELVVPLFRNNKIVAILGVGNKESLYDQYDVEMLTRLADSAIDITERKSYEEEVKIYVEQQRNINEELSSKNEELKKSRTATLNIIDDLSSEIGERKKVLQALSISNKRYLELALQSRTVTWEVDKNGLFVYLSEACEVVYGYKPSELVNKLYYYDLNPEETRSEFKEQTMKNFLTHEPYTNLENEIVTKDGKHLWVLTNGYPVFNSDGDFIGFQGTNSDITERKKTEEELLESKAEYKNFVEKSNEGIYFIQYEEPIDITLPVDEQVLAVINKGVLSECNLAMAKMYGYSKQEDLIGKTMFELYGGNINEINYETTKNFVTNNYQIEDLETLEYDVEGNEKYFLNSVIGVIKDNKLLGNWGTQRDITQRKKAEQALIKSEGRYKSLFEEHSAVKFLINPEDGAIIDANQAASDFYGWSREELKQMKLSAINCISAEELQEAIRKVLKEKKVRFEFKHRLANGTIKDVEVFSSRIEIGGKEHLHSIIHDLTERKIAEKALSESEEKYRKLVEDSPDAIAIYVKGKIVYVNNATLKLMNVQTQDELLGQPVLKFVHPDSMEIVLQRLKKLQNEHESLPIAEEKFVRFDGSTVEVEVKATSVVFNGEKGVQLIVRDISDRKKAEEKIIQLSRAVEQSPVSIVITNLDGNIEYVNPKTIEVTRYSYKEVLGENPRIFSSGELPKEEYKKLWDTITSGQEWRGELHNKKKNGELYWEYSSISPIKDESGKFTHYLAVKEDITERKLAEEELQNQAKFRQLLTEISANYINLSLDKVKYSIHNSLEVLGKFVKADRAYMFDYNNSTGKCSMAHEWCNEGIDSRLNELQNIPLSSEWIESFNKAEALYIPDISAMAGGEGKSILKSAGIQSIISVPMLDGNECIGFIGFDSINNKHQYSETEQQLLHLYAQILVNIKFRIIGEKELIDAKEKAETANKFKDAFIANISHEIRTPLNGILGMTSIIKEAFSDFAAEDEKYYFTSVETSSKRLIKTVDLIVNFSRIQVGDFAINPIEFSLSDIINNIVTEYLPIANEKSVSLNFKASIANFKIFADEYTVSTSLINIVDNAIKFTDAGSVNIDLYRDKSNLICIAVTDTGIGISDDYLPNLFTPYSQEEFGYNRAYEGVGLGLSLVKKFLDLNNISIKVESKKNEGSKFTLVFNDSGSAESTTGVAENIIESKKEIIRKERKTSKPAILVVEDDGINQLYLKSVLVKDYEIVIASSADKAIKVFEENDFDLVIMDISLKGGMNGLELTKLIRDGSKNPNVPIIAVTGHAFPEDQQKTVESGCDDYLAKPFESFELLEKINQLIRE